MYSEKLINEVKRLYPDRPDILNLAEKGDKWLGRALFNHMDKFIPIDRILACESNDELGDLYHQARKQKERLDLYDLWTKEYNERK